MTAGSVSQSNGPACVIFSQPVPASPAMELSTMNPAAMPPVVFGFTQRNKYSSGTQKNAAADAGESGQESQHGADEQRQRQKKFPHGHIVRLPARAEEQDKSRRRQHRAEDDFVGLRADVDFAAEPRARHGGDGERKQNFPVEMPGLPEPPPGNAGDENVGNQHRHACGRGRDADQRERGEITRRAAVADGRIKKCDSKNGGEQQADLDWRKINHGLEVLEIAIAFWLSGMEHRTLSFVKYNAYTKLLSQEQGEISPLVCQIRRSNRSCFQRVAVARKLACSIC